MFNTLETQYVLRQYWYMNIEHPLMRKVPAIFQPQLFKAPLPDYSGSDHGGEETRRAHEVFIEEEDEVNFLDQEYSGLYDDKVWECIECYLNLPETSHLD